MQRKIIHCDADCFYAAIEMRDDPSLKNRPMAVGGHSHRGVLTTCNYEARRYGVRSAMPSSQAMRLCPDLIIVKGNMAKYREASELMREVFLSYSELVEPLSLDEAFLDVTDCDQYQGSATLIAKAIRSEIEARLRITVSAGVAPNKFLAKVASDWHKPNGLKVITPGEVNEFVKALPVRLIHGVGKVTAEKLERLGVKTCEQLRIMGAVALSKHFGRFGPRLWELAHGLDDRSVSPERARKSCSVEHTYTVDIPDYRQCEAQLPQLLKELNARLARLDERYVVSKAFVKAKFSDFSHTTVERAGTSACLADYSGLLEKALSRQQRPVRLLGLGVRFRNICHSQFQQLDLFDVGL